MATEATTQATTATTTNTAADPQQQPKVTFSPEQQARIDEIIRESMGRAGSDARREAQDAQTRLQTLQTELESAKAELTRLKPGQAKNDAKAEAEALAAQITEMRAIHSQNAAEMERLKQIAASKDREVESAKKDALNIRKQNAIQATATQHGFVDVDVVTSLTQESIQWDPEKSKFYVQGDNGQPRLNSAYEPMTLDEFFQEYATKKPYLVRGDVKSGAGSTEAQRSTMNQMGKYPVDQIFGKTANAALANKLALSNHKEYQRLKAEARDKGLIRW